MDDSDKNLDEAQAVEDRIGSGDERAKTEEAETVSEGGRPTTDAAEIASEDGDAAPDQAEAASEPDPAETVTEDGHTTLEQAEAASEPHQAETASEDDPAGLDEAATASEDVAGDLPDQAEEMPDAIPDETAAVAEVEEPRAPQVSEELKRIIEALIYASPDPLTPKTLFKVLESEPREDVQASLESLQQDYAQGRGGLHLVEVAGGFQIVTRPELSEWVRRLFHERKTQKLSVQALETLAVVAYKQPITGPEIAEIRGVNTSGVIATLLERHLLKIAGRKQVVGRPFLYATTREFLIRFGLRDLNDLPKMEDMADVLGFEPPSGLAEAGPSETLLPLGGPDPDRTLAVQPEGEADAEAQDAAVSPEPAGNDSLPASPEPPAEEPEPQGE